MACVTKFSATIAMCFCSLFGIQEKQTNKAIYFMACNFVSVDHIGTKFDANQRDFNLKGQVAQKNDTG